MSLNKEKADLYFSYEEKHYQSPAGIDDKLFEEFLIENKIPRNELVVNFKNGGNAPNKVIKFSIQTDEAIVWYSFVPSKSEKPIWVELPENKELGFSSDVKSVVEPVGNLAPNKLLSFMLGYEGPVVGNPLIEVFGDGRKAKFVEDIKAVPEWNRYRVFYLPAYVLLAGLSLTLLWILFSVVLSNKQYRALFVDVASSVGGDLMASMPLFGSVYLSFKRALQKTE